MSNDRSTTIGASEIASLFDCSPYESRFSLLCKKTGITPPEDFDDHTTRQQIGLDLERPVLEIWARREGFIVDHNTHSMRAPSLVGLSATPDGLVIVEQPNGIRVAVATVDIKTVRPHQRKDWLGGIPKHYWWQQQQQMAVCGVPRGYLVALFGVDEIAATCIEVDYDAQAQILREADIFWQQARGELPWPSPDSHRATLEVLMRREREYLTTDFDRKAKSDLLNALGTADRGVFANGAGYRVQRIGGKKPHNRLVRFTGENTETGDDDE